MSYEVCIASAEDRAWLCKRARVRNAADLFVLQALDRDGQIKGQIGVELLSRNSAEVHIALDAAGALGVLLPPICKIAYGAQRRYAVARVRGDNEKSLRLCRHLGFEELGRLVDGCDNGVDMVMMALRRDKCRWLEVIDG